MCACVYISISIDIFCFPPVCSYRHPRKTSTSKPNSAKQQGRTKARAKYLRQKYVLAQRAQSAKLRTQIPKTAKKRTQKIIT